MRAVVIPEAMFLRVLAGLVKRERERKKRRVTINRAFVY